MNVSVSLFDCLFVCVHTSFMLWTECCSVDAVCWCSAWRHRCYCSFVLFALSTFVDVFVCILFELRDILRRFGNTQTPHTHTHCNANDTETNNMNGVLYTCIDYYYMSVCMWPCFVSNMSSVVRNASLICYTAIARSSSSPLSASWCVIRSFSHFFSFHLWTEITSKIKLTKITGIGKNKMEKNQNQMGKSVSEKMKSMYRGRERHARTHANEHAIHKRTSYTN